MTNLSPARRLTAATAIVVLAVGALTACSSGPVLNRQARLELPLEAWGGGPSFYAQFPQAAASGWTDPAFFPIAVFGGKPEDAAALWAIGVNTYMGAEHDGAQMSTITGVGMSVLAQPEWTIQEIGDDPRVVGWTISDECDMGYSDCGDDQYAQLAKQKQYAAAARSSGDGRFLQANFGNGVLGTFWSKDTMRDHVSLVDVTSVDKYAYTSPHVRSVMAASPRWPAGKNLASSFAYGWLQDQMETFTSPEGSKPNWVLVETGMPYLTEVGASTISGEQIEGAVWNAIIEGASGIAYFQHNNNGVCGTYSLIACPQARAAVARTNAQIHSLAPVLNTQSSAWSFGPGLQSALKVRDGYAYMFAMTDGGSGSRSLTLPPGVRGNTVEVVGENRLLAVTDGKFTDTFASEYTHHTYRLII